MNFHICVPTRRFSKIIPRYLVLVFSGMGSLFMIRDIFESFFWGGWKRIKLDFDTFNESLFALSHTATLLVQHLYFLAMYVYDDGIICCCVICKQMKG